MYVSTRGTVVHCWAPAGMNLIIIALHCRALSPIHNWRVNA